MDYVIVGAGSLGQSFAALLARSGEHVTLLATPRSADRLHTNGSIRLHGALEAEIPVGANGVAVTSEAKDVPDGAAVVFATKGYDLADAIASVRSAAGRRIAWVAGVQNGIVKDDLLAAAFGADRVVAAATIFGAGRQPDGSVLVMSPGATYFGELNVTPQAKDPTRTRDREATAGRNSAPGPVSHASMTQDLLPGAPLEVDAIFGDIVQRAEAKAVAVPALRLVRDLIRGLDLGQTPR